jgi:hypothetical protein
MSKAVISKSERIYGVLLKLYPTRYRQEFGEEMKYVFSESLKDAYRENGGQGIISLWVRTTIDAGKSIVAQHVEKQKGGDFMNSKKTDIITQNKIFLWIALVTGFILILPLVAMKFTSDVNWTIQDFIIMGVLLFGTGSIFVFLARKMQKKKYRIAIGFILVLSFLYIWAELAVGIFTN